MYLLKHRAVADWLHEEHVTCKAAGTPGGCIRGGRGVRLGSGGRTHVGPAASKPQVWQGWQGWRAMAGRMLGQRTAKPRARLSHLPGTSCCSPGLMPTQGSLAPSCHPSHLRSRPTWPLESISSTFTGATLATLRRKLQQQEAGAAQAGSKEGEGCCQGIVHARGEARHGMACVHCTHAVQYRNGWDCWQIADNNPEQCTATPPHRLMAWFLSSGLSDFFSTASCTPWRRR
jgi:hypothetical protein